MNCGFDTQWEYKGFGNMRNTILALILCLTATSASALTVDIPTEPVAVGQLVKLTIEGVDPSMLSETKAFCWPEAGTTFIPAKLWDNRPVIFFQAKHPGDYLVYVNTPIKGADATEDIKVVITVIGDGPEPDPEPRPDPIPPPVPGELSVVVLYESSARNPSEILTLTALRAHAQTCDYLFRLEDKDLVDGRTRTTPAWMVPYLETLNTSRVQVPAIVIGRTSPDGRFSGVVVPLPAGGAVAIAVRKKHGG